MLYHIIVTLLGNCLAQAGRLSIALSCVKGTRGPNKECGTASEKVTENSGGAERSEDMPVHSMSCKTNL